MTGDRSPIISKTPVGGYASSTAGWGTGGFKAIPGSGWGFAELMATGLFATDREPLAWTVSTKAASSTKAWPRGWRTDAGLAFILAKLPRGFSGGPRPPAGPVRETMPCPYDPKMADQMREDLGDLPGLSEKTMFGGLCFLLDGNMICGRPQGWRDVPGRQTRRGRGRLAIQVSKPLGFYRSRRNGRQWSKIWTQTKNLPMTMPA